MAKREAVGRKRPSQSLLAVLEALFAAIAFDSSYTQATKFIEKLYAEYLDNPKYLISKDFKSILQEYLQSRKMSLPVYDLHGTEGPDHDMILHIECMIPDLKIKVKAQGRNKKEASQVAAESGFSSNPFIQWISISITIEISFYVNHNISDKSLNLLNVWQRPGYASM